MTNLQFNNFYNKMVQKKYFLKQKKNNKTETTKNVFKITPLRLIKSLA